MKKEVNYLEVNYSTIAKHKLTLLPGFTSSLKRDGHLRIYLILLNY